MKGAGLLMLERIRPFRFLLLTWLWLPMTVTMTGCQGCRDWLSDSKSEEEEKKEDELGEKEKPKPDFERMKVTILPGTIPLDDVEEDDGDDESDGELDESGEAQLSIARRVAVKPGHWVHARYKLKANNFDFKGNLTARCVDGSMRPRDLERSPFWVTSTRPAVLPKAQSKEVELPVFITVPTNRARKRTQLHATLQSRGSGRAVQQDYAFTIRLKPHQYHMVVLARNPDRYGWLRSTQTVKPPHSDWAMDGVQEDYLVTFHRYEEGESLPLPGNPLAWTSIAYMIWDDMPPDALNPDQQAALMDWLQWGGQLLISGPESLDLLRGSFLADYLPADTGKVAVVTSQALAEINAYWSLVPASRELDASRYELRSSEESPLEIVPLTPKPAASFMPHTGELVVEQPVGRGRIVATAFGMGIRRIVNWQNYDGFLNGCLMRRPGRRFKKTSTSFPGVDWTDFSMKSKDARLTCKLRYFSRDALIPGEGRNRYRDGPDERRDREVLERRRDNERSALRELSDETFVAEGAQRERLWGLNVERSPKQGRMYSVFGYGADNVSGVGGWSDFTPTANASRRSLQKAAGIDVPDAEFVVKVLAAYVICLVPVNWLIFRILRRVEWAWFAAPVIAIGGAFGVAKLAELDIGFVRSRTEIAIVEMQPDYTRAHLTRFSGFYTSLTSQYGVTFEDSRAHALPFSLDPPFDQLRLQKRQRVAYVRDKSVGMSGYPVLSNSTGMVHTEQMIEMTGGVKLVAADANALQVLNDTAFDLQCVVLVTLTQQGVRMAVAPELAAGEEVSLTLGDVGEGGALFEMLETSSATSARFDKGIVNLRELYRLAVNSSQLKPGDVRVVGWSLQEVEGMDVRPKSTQQTFRTIFVSNLRYGPAGMPEVDANHFADFRRDPDEDESVDLLLE